jgi:hypothetical protein
MIFHIYNLVGNKKSMGEEKIKKEMEKTGEKSKVCGILWVVGW